LCPGFDHFQQARTLDLFRAGGGHGDFGAQKREHGLIIQCGRRNLGLASPPALNFQKMWDRPAVSHQFQITEVHVVGGQKPFFIS
jgi:hypothetical protein